MNMVMQVLIDHRESCKCEGQQRCNEEKSIKLKISSLSEEGMANTVEDPYN